METGHESDEESDSWPVLFCGGESVDDLEQTRYR